MGRKTTHYSYRQNALENGTAPGKPHWLTGGRHHFPVPWHCSDRGGPVACEGKTDRLVGRIGDVDQGAGLLGWDGRVGRKCAIGKGRNARSAATIKTTPAVVNSGAP